MDKLITTVTVAGIEIPAEYVVCRECRVLDLNTEFRIPESGNGQWNLKCGKGHEWSFYFSQGDNG